MHGKHRQKDKTDELILIILSLLIAKTFSRKFMQFSYRIGVFQTGQPGLDPRLNLVETRCPIGYLA